MKIDYDDFKIYNKIFIYETFNVGNSKINI